MRRIINNVVSVIHSALRFGGLKVFHGKRLKVGIIERLSPNVVLEMNKGANVFIGKKVRIHSGCKIKVRNGANLVINDEVKVNYYCIVACHDNIEIGEGTELGPCVFLYDHDHDYKAGLKNNKFKKGSIRIGKKCWIGANTIILRGTTIGDNCVIGAGCVLKGDYPDNTVIVQKRETQTYTYTI